MLVIRLARTGRTKYPTYRIVAAESARAATSKFVAVLGHYNPHTKELVIQREETARYLSNGAQPSNTVIKLLQREGVEMPAWAKLKTKAPKPVEAPAEAEAAAEEASAEEAAQPETEEVAQETAPAEEERVAAVAEETAADAEDDSTRSINHTDTAADNDESIAKAEDTEAAAADAATEERAANSDQA